MVWEIRNTYFIYTCTYTYIYDIITVAYLWNGLFSLKFLMTMYSFQIISSPHQLEKHGGVGEKVLYGESFHLISERNPRPRKAKCLIQDLITFKCLVSNSNPGLLIQTRFIFYKRKMLQALYSLWVSLSNYCPPRIFFQIIIPHASH